MVVACLLKARRRRRSLLMLNSGPLVRPKKLAKNDAGKMTISLQKLIKSKTIRGLISRRKR